MSTTLLILCIVLMALALVMSYRPWLPGAIFALGALFAGQRSGHLQFSNSALTFWTIATAIVLIISFMLPRMLVQTTRGLGYMTTATLAGAIVGSLLGPKAVVAGAAVGAFLGALAFSRTADGSQLGFPSNRFLQYLCAKGLPLVVTMSMIGLALVDLLNS